MADISMCHNDGCPRRNNCYRYTAPVNEHWQVYATFPDEGDSYDECEHFVDNKDYRNSKHTATPFQHLYRPK